MTPIKVVIVDDHPVFRRGLRGVLEETEDIEVVGEAADGAEAVALVVDTGAAVVLMDLIMAGTGGVDATAELAAVAPDVAVLVLTMSSDQGSAQAALRAGARGYLVKGASGDAIVAAVRSVAAGTAVLGSAVAQDLISGVSVRGPRSERLFPELTERELEVLDQVAQGLSNTEIAHVLVLSEKTIRNYMSALFLKLGVPDRSRAIVLARQQGLGNQSAPPNASGSANPQR